MRTLHFQGVVAALVLSLLAGCEPGSDGPPPPPQQMQLEVAVTGPGEVVITTAERAQCANRCTYALDAGAVVTLTAAPDPGAVFKGWSGACSGTGECTVELDAAAAVNAEFAPGPPPPRAALTVSRAGAGTGRITSAPGGIDCGDTCRGEWDQGTQITLTAAPADGSAFRGWSGSCSGTGGCTVTLGGDTSVTATFDRAEQPPPPDVRLTVERAGAGIGRVTSEPSGIDCGAVCVVELPPGTTVRLAATPDAGSTFTGWAGACSGTGTCEVLLDGAVTISAGFERRPPAYEVVEIEIPGGGGAAEDMNQAGDVVGNSFATDSTTSRAFLWTRATGTTTFIDVGAPLGASAVALNDGGDVVLNAADGTGRVFRWRAGTAESIGGAEGAELMAWDIGNQGWIVGTVRRPEGFRAFLHDGTAIRELEGLPSARDASALAVNGRGDVVGDSGGAAVVYVDGVARDLGFEPRAMALDVSENGIAVGEGKRAFKWAEHAFLVDLRTGATTRVDPPPGFFGVSLQHVNAAGQAVGWPEGGRGRHPPLLWSGGKLENLEELAGLTWRIQTTNALNDRGEILVNARDEESRVRMLVLRPRQ